LQNKRRSVNASNKLNKNERKIKRKTSKRRNKPMKRRLN
jgi:hypothetical protein